MIFFHKEFIIRNINCYQNIIIWGVRHKTRIIKQYMIGFWYRLICDAVHDFISINACRIFIKIVIVGNKLRKRYSMISPEMP